MLANIEYRTKWAEGIKEIKTKKDEINQSGVSHLCVLSNNTSFEVETFIERRENSSLVLGEMNQSPPIGDQIFTILIVTPGENEDESILTFEVNMDGSGFLFKLLKPLVLIKLKSIMKKNMNNIVNNAASIIKENKIELK